MFLSVHISSSALLSTKIINSFTNALKVQIQENNIKDICTTTGLLKCILLDAGYNLIQNIRNECFVRFSFLSVLVLNTNLITFIQKYSFLNLLELKLLDISNNPLKAFPEFNSENVHSFKMLNISNVSRKGFNIKAFVHVTLNVIITNDCHICCMATGKTFVQLIILIFLILIFYQMFH